MPDTPLLPLDDALIASARMALKCGGEDASVTVCVKARKIVSFAESETVPTKPDPVSELCAYIKDSIRLCGHGYIHMTCGDCQRRD